MRCVHIFGDNEQNCFDVVSASENGKSFFMLCVQRSWITLASASSVAVIASEPCS